MPASLQLDFISSPSAFCILISTLPLLFMRAIYRPGRRPWCQFSAGRRCCESHSHGVNSSLCRFAGFDAADARSQLQEQLTPKSAHELRASLFMSLLVTSPYNFISHSLFCYWVTRKIYFFDVIHDFSLFVEGHDAAAFYELFACADCTTWHGRAWAAGCELRGVMIYAALLESSFRYFHFIIMPHATLFHYSYSIAYC